MMRFFLGDLYLSNRDPAAIAKLKVFVHFKHFLLRPHVKKQPKWKTERALFNT